MTDLDIIEISFNKAKRPEDLFGVAADPTDLKHSLKASYHILSRAVHPDLNGNSEQSVKLTQILNVLYEEALKKINAGTYGTAPTTFSIKTKHHTIDVFDFIETVGVADSYECVIDGTVRGIINIARTPADNDIMKNEASVLKRFSKDTKPGATHFAQMLPRLIDTATIDDNGTWRHANVFEKPNSEYVTLAEVMVYKQLHPKDMAWIWRRLLDILGYAHAFDIIHGAVTPDNILIGLGDVHQVILTNWQSSIERGGIITLAYGKYKQYYPKEVVEKTIASRSTDIYMSARVMQEAMGDWLHKAPSIKGFLLSCCMPSINSRTKDAWEVRRQFKDLIVTLWGAREYRPLYLEEKK